MPCQDFSQFAPRPEAASLAALREAYFAFLAQKFPTLCLHDEFIFFPRLTAAWDHWSQVAQLEASVIEAAASQVAEFLSRLKKCTSQSSPREDPAEAVLLRQSLMGVHRELSPGGSWEMDPFLYLKVASLAWAPVLAQAPHLDWLNQEKLAKLLSQVAQLFTWGQKQVRTLTLPAHLLAPGAFADAHRFFREVVPAFLAARFSLNTTLKRCLEEVSHSLLSFQERVAALPGDAPFARGEAGLAEILDESWGWPKGAETAAALLKEEIQESEGALAHWAARIQPGLTWRQLLGNFKPPATPVDLLSLYRREVASLWEFWEQSGVLPPLTGRVEVAETPVYLRTLRSSASYAAPWGPPEASPGFFYLSPETENLAHHLQHFRCLSAHETVPGHHLLDTTRLTLAWPTQRQYESPLFYEGWSCYGETLLFSQGYLSAPWDHLVGWQRRLWRALRGLVDLELQGGRLGLEEGLERLRQAGYPEVTARLQILHLALNPGYQLCYTLGLKEMLQLRGAGPRPWVWPGFMRSCFPGASCLLIWWQTGCKPQRAPLDRGK